MTLAELQATCYQDCGYESSPGSVVADRFKTWINEANRVVLSLPGMMRLRNTLSPLTFTSEADRFLYGLPASLSQVRAITERDNDRILVSMTLPDLRLTDPGLTATGTPYAFVPLGYRVIQRNVDSTGLWAESTAAGDTNDIQVNGIRASFLPTGDVSQTMTGVTRVQIGTLTDYVDVQSISLSAVAVGIVSIYDAAVSGNVIAQIPIGKVAPQYFVIQLWPTPSAATVYYCDGEESIPVLDDAQDVPMIPEDFHYVLAAYARMREWERLGDSRLNTAAQHYNEGIHNLRYRLGQPAERRVMGKLRQPRYSRYGPYYPAGSGWD